MPNFSQIFRDVTEFCEPISRISPENKILIVISLYLVYDLLSCLMFSPIPSQDSGAACSDHTTDVNTQVKIANKFVTRDILYFALN
jgi:hypothetical protein